MNAIDADKMLSPISMISVRQRLDNDRDEIMNVLMLALLSRLSRRPIRRSEQLAWPQFRGPEGSGIAEDQKPPVEIGPDKNVKWKVAVPSGLSSPIVVGDKLVITAFDNGKLYTIAYNRADGSEAWRAEAPAKKIEPY